MFVQARASSIVLDQSDLGQGQLRISGRSGGTRKTRVNRQGVGRRRATRLAEGCLPHIRPAGRCLMHGRFSPPCKAWTEAVVRPEESTLSSARPSKPAPSLRSHTVVKCTTTRPVSHSVQWCPTCFSPCCTSPSPAPPVPPLHPRVSSAIPAVRTLYLHHRGLLLNLGQPCPHTPPAPPKPLWPHLGYLHHRGLLLHAFPLGRRYPSVALLLAGPRPDAQQRDLGVGRRGGNSSHLGDSSSYSTSILLKRGGGREGGCEGVERQVHS